MRRLLGIVLGGALGYVANGLLLWLCGLLPGPIAEAFGQGLIWLGYPMAHFLSLVLRMPFQQEAALLLMLYGIQATFVLVGAIGGWVVPRWRW